MKTRSVNVPQPAGILLPVKEKPRTVVPAAWTTNPAPCASPPDAPDTATPSTSNWKPPIALFEELYKTEPSKRYKVFTGRSQPSVMSTAPPSSPEHDEPSPSHSPQASTTAVPPQAPLQS